MPSRARVMLLGLLLGAVGCSDRDPPSTIDGGTTTRDAGGADTGGRDAGAIDAGTGTDTGATGDDAGTPAGECGADTICLAVRPFETGTPAPGRLLAVWFQLNDDGPDPPMEIGYDVAFDTAATRVEIPLASITTPTEAVLLCERACDDEAMCPCLNDVRAGMGLVLVAADADGNGRIDEADFDAGGGIRGVAWLALGWSAMEHIPAPLPLAGKFIEGILMGAAAYRIVDTGTFDDLGLPAPGMVFDLNVCVTTNPACDLPFPNLT